MNGEPAGGVGGAKDLMSDVEPGKTVWEETAGLLKVMEYRYTKFALDPTTGRWAMIRDWRDPKWTSNRAVAQGLGNAVRKQRLVLMGENIIDIASKSVVGLLVDEVSISVILIIRFSRTICAGFTSVLRLPNRFNYPLVP